MNPWDYLASATSLQTEHGSSNELTVLPHLFTDDDDFELMFSGTNSMPFIGSYNETSVFRDLP